MGTQIRTGSMIGGIADRASAIGKQFRKRGISLWKGTLFAVPASVAWYGALFPLEGSYVHTLFYERGPIPFLCTFLFFLCIVQLGLKLLRVRAETAALESQLSKQLMGIAKLAQTAREGTEQGAEQQMHTLIGSAKDTERDLLVTGRLRRAVSEIASGAGATEIGAAMTDQADTDAQVAESSYFLVKFLIWVVPILGFVGTVVGIAAAISNFDTIVQGASSITAIKGQMGGITASLGIAFETTLIALVMSALMMLAFAVVQKREEDMLAIIHQWVMEELAVGGSGEVVPPPMPDVGGPALQGGLAGGGGASEDLGEVLRKLSELEESHNRELEQLRVAFGENASAMGTAQQIAESLQATREIQQQLQQSIGQFNEVTARYIDTLRQIYKLGD